MDAVRVPITKADHARGLPLPAYMTAHAAGLDLLAAVDESVIVLPGERALIPTGLHIALPEGYEAQVRPRSGLALRHGVTLLNSPGTIDADYRGEIRVIIINHGKEPFAVSRGERIAQLIVAPVARAVLEETDGLPGSIRNEGGFGHTGI